MSLAETILRIRQEMPKLTGLKLNNVAGVSRTEEGWKVTVEMVEKESIPSSVDVLGLYEVYINREGNILGFERKALRKRIDVEISKPE